jgi:hypothetical protein
VCEQTNGKREKKTRESIARMCIKKKRTKRHEHTYTPDVTQNKETDREEKTEDVVEIEIQIDCTSTGLFQKEKKQTNKNVLCMFFLFTYAVQVMMDQVENNLDVKVVVAAVADKNVVEMT